MKSFFHTISLLAFVAICSIAAEKSKELKELEEKCTKLVKEGKCPGEDDKSNECPFQCKQWMINFYQETFRFSTFGISESIRDDFWDMTVKNSTGYVMSVEQFEGFITVIIPITKNCQNEKVPVHEVMTSIENLQKVWPRTVEIMVFPFEHPNLDYKDLDCTDFEKEYKKKGRPIHVMEMTTLNGPKTNPLLEKLKTDVMRAEELTVNTTQYFVLNPNWSKLQYHYHKSVLDIKDIVQEMINIMDRGDEL